MAFSSQGLITIALKGKWYLALKAMVINEWYFITVEVLSKIDSKLSKNILYIN